MNQILDREGIYQEIKAILTNYEENCKNIQFKKGIYIYGSPGCGKTYFITEILQDLNYDIIKYDAGDIRNKALIDTITSNNIGSQNVLQMMKRAPKKIAIIMDEIDGMNNGDKGGITSLIKLIRQKKTKKQRLEHHSNNPIICIGNYYVDKKIKELMKVCHTFELKPISKNQLYNIIKLQMPLLSSNLSENPEYKPLYDKMAEYIQGDFRKLDFIKKIYEKNPNIEESLFSFFNLKTFNEDSKKITHRLLTTDLSFGEHSRIINDTDRTIIALLWHENIVDMLSRLPNHHSIPFYLEILDNICFSDYIDRITFQNQIWQFNEMSSLMKTFYNNHLYHKKYGKGGITDNFEIRFTKVLTKYSTEYNNILFIYNLCQELHMDKKDLIALFQELRLFFGAQTIQQNIGQLETIFENYNISKLDIKRIYRYLDKNVKKDICLVDDIDSSDIDE